MSWSRRRWLTGLGAIPWLGCAGGSESRPPRTPEQVDVRLPSMALGRLDAGPSLYLMEDHGLPLVSMAVAVGAGHRLEAAGEEGRAAVAAALLLEGMEGGDRAALLDRYGELGTTPHASVGASHIVLRCVVHRDDAPTALRLMLDNLRHPTIAEDAFAKVVRERRESLLAARGIVEVVAGFGLVRGSWGSDPAVALLADGTPTSVDALELPQARAWISGRLGLDTTSFSFAGDVDEASALRWIGDATDGWPATAAVRAAPQSPVPDGDPTAPRIVVVPWPELPQAVVAMGGPRRPPGHDDEPAEAIAGSLMAGLVHYELRSRQRVSYGVQTRAWSTKRGPMAQLWAKVEPAEVDTAVEQLWIYLRRLERDVQLTDEAVTEARRAAMVGMMHDHHGAESGLGELLELADRGASAHWAQRRLDRLEQLSTADVTRALRRIYDPAQVRFCVVGDPKSIERARTALPEGPTVERTPDQLFGLS